MRSDDTYTLTVPDTDKLLEAYGTYQSLDFFDYVTYDAFELHPHLRAMDVSHL